MKKRGPIILVLLPLIFLCSCQSTHAPSRPGDHKRKVGVKFNGLSRSYRLHVPPGDPEVEKPLVIVLHGAFSKAKTIERETGFSRLADEESFYVVYPNGIGIFGFLQHWNAGHCCGKAAKDNVDDVAYLDAVIDDVLATCRIDKSNVFMVGHSNGGMMVYRYVAECAERIAGAAVVAGAIDSKSKLQTWCLPQPVRPVPMLIMHGSLDGSIPMNGGARKGKSDDISFASVFDAEAFWKQNNKNNAPVQLVLLDGWGHDWPGQYYTRRAHAEDPIRDYDAAPIIWDFFKEQAWDD